MNKRPVTEAAGSLHLDVHELREFEGDPPVGVRDGASATTLAALTMTRAERLTSTAKLFEDSPGAIEIDQIATLFVGPLQEVEHLVAAILSDPSIKPPSLDEQQNSN